IIYGALALLPIAAVAYIGFELFTIIQGLVSPIYERLGTNPLLSLLLLLALAIIALAAFCYFIGVLITTRLGAVSFEKVETRVRKLVPGYEIVARVAKGVAGEKWAYEPAMITLGAPGAAVLGFVMEDQPDNPYLTVFVPSAPVLTVGGIHVVERARVQTIDGSSTDAANCITQWGLGVQKFRGTATPMIAGGTAPASGA
ncbi:MAG: DUF502 domain-containing protein, partial [Hyphomicrobiales bacterium]|nr:DUF502 domain-containing protein [Hyphomicrobiales bacterium]